MKEKIKNAWTFVKEHKKAFAIATVTAIGGIAIMVICKNKSSIPDCWCAGTIHTSNSKDIDVVGWNMGEMHECWSEKEGVVNAIVDNLSVADIGKLGEEFCTMVDGICADSSVAVIIGISNENK